MSVVPYSTAVPASSGEIRVTDPRIGIEIERKHDQVREFLETHRYDALFLQSPHNFSWFTTGGTSTRALSSEPIAAIFITPEARVVICGNADSGQLFDRDLYGLGFQLKERPWHQSLQTLAEDICRGRNVASDVSLGDTKKVTDLLIGLRNPLSPFEQTRLSELGKQVAHAVEATCRSFQLGQTESEIAGELAHRLLKHGIEPETLQVMADGQGHRYRHWSFGDDTVERYCVISAVGRRSGLHAGACRVVAFGEPAKDVRHSHHLALMLQATASHFSRGGMNLNETWTKLNRIYEKFNIDEEWQWADFGNVIGYHPRELLMTPAVNAVHAAGSAIWWHPSVGPSMVGDTILVTDKGHELITPANDWPKLRVEVKSDTYFLPDILPRE